jgi:pimeloyl-ACP methyl ester carboxylesterase
MSEATAPGWFLRALAATPEHRELDVEGARIHYRAWGDRDRPGLVLIHGGAAHSGWWDHVAPLLTSHRVVAPDLSGHGDSGRREGYDLHGWAREVLAVADAQGLERPVVVGHSMGGWVSVTCGVDAPGRVAGVAYVDSPLNDQPPERSRMSGRPRRAYPTVEEALAHFRTLPPQEVLLPSVRDHVARESLHAVEGGWTWKFDPAFSVRELVRLRDLLPQLAVPVALLRCEHGLVDEAMAAEMARLVPGGLPVAALPDCGHHPMLDRPLALVAALRTLLAVWP